METLKKGELEDLVKSREQLMTRATNWLKWTEIRKLQMSSRIFLKAEEIVSILSPSLYLTNLSSKWQLDKEKPEGKFKFLVIWKLKKTKWS